MKIKTPKTPMTTGSTRNEFILNEWNKVRSQYPRFPDFLTIFLQEEQEIISKLSKETLKNGKH